MQAASMSGMSQAGLRSQPRLNVTPALRARGRCGGEQSRLCLPRNHIYFPLLLRAGRRASCSHLKMSRREGHGSYVEMRHHPVLSLPAKLFSQETGATKSYRVKASNRYRGRFDCTWWHFGSVVMLLCLLTASFLRPRMQLSNRVKHASQVTLKLLLDVRPESFLLFWIP